MQTSKLKMLGQLYSKDLHEITPEIVVTIGLTVAVFVAMWFATEGQSNLRGLAILPILFAMGLAGFLPIITSFKLLGREWSNNTVYLIMSLPVSGTMIMGSKLLVLLTQYVLGTVLAGLSGALLLFSIPEVKQLIANYPQVFSYTIAVYILCICGVFYLCCSSFLAQIIGKLSKKYSGLATAGAFIFILYVVNKIMHYVGTWFDFNKNLLVNIQPNMVNIQSHILGMDASVFKSICTASGIYVLFSVLIMVLAIIIYERKIEL